MAKKLISLISAAGKTKEEIVKQTWEAFLKYQAVEGKASSETAQPNDRKPPAAPRQPAA